MGRLSVHKHQEITLVLEAIENVASSPDDERPIWEVAAALVRDIPEDALNVLPTDGAARHDYYLHVAPKRG